MENILELKEKLRIARANNADAIARFSEKNEVLLEQIRALQTAWNEENAELLDELQTIATVLENAENELRQALKAHYVQTGEKTFDKQLSIRATPILVYSESEALEWAKKHGLCLALDTRAFEKIASVQPLDFVAKNERISAVIAKNLEAEQ